MQNAFHSPNHGLRGRLEEWLANNTLLRRLRRSLLSRLPFVTLTSDVRDVVYANWVVPVSKVRQVVPDRIQLVERDGTTVLTVLTYRHTHFGPALLGPLRALFPSPLQSNWRLYIDAVDGQRRSSLVLFIRNVFDSLLYALVTRVLSDVLPSQTARAFTHACSANDCETTIVDTEGTLGLHLAARVEEARILPKAFAALFDSWDEAVRSLALQDAAIAQIPDEAALAHSRIDLPIDLRTVEPLQATHIEAGPWLRSLGAEGPPLCFRVPAVRLRALSDTLIR
ncbi:DUF2071 domain-containing protein [uncultured Sphingomonas sp.]|uniref:DUF2071 domain-containing protein n=1 Tax=uncultured Sphingomonas sp. TaxID=158754 RepID=UPI0025CFE9B2|nr:DUF2071 domain-containing protein [uncultured Sphingomonas sp.]